MKRLLMLLLLISLGLNLGLALRLRQAPPPAEPGRGQGARLRPAPGDTQAWRERMDRRFRHMSRRLDLDEAQQAAFRRHRLQVEGEVRRLTATLAANRDALRAEAQREPPDPAAVTAALREVGRAEAALDSLVAVNLAAELELLRPEQQSRLLRMLRLERLDGERGHGRGRGHRRGPGTGSGGGASGE